MFLNVTGRIVSGRHWKRENQQELPVLAKGLLPSVFPPLIIILSRKVDCDAPLNQTGSCHQEPREGQTGREFGICTPGFSWNWLGVLRARRSLRIIFSRKVSPREREILNG